jgi:hypothetical protein
VKGLKEWKIDVTNEDKKEIVFPGIVNGKN